MAAVCLSCGSGARTVRPTREDPYVHAIAGAMEEQNRRLSAALREYAAAAHIEDSPYLWHKVGTLSLRVGDVERASSALAVAVHGPDAPIPWLRQAAAVHSLSGRPLEALKIHLRVLDAQPGDHGSALAAAKILVGIDESDSAAAVLETMDPPWPMERALALDRARLLLSVGRPDLASTLCESRGSGDPEALLICAEALGSLDRVDDAARHYLRAAGEARCQERIADLCFQSLLRLGRPAEAAEVAAWSQECPGSPGAWVTRKALALAMNDRREEAQDLLHARLRIEPDDIAALDLLVSITHRIGEHGRMESLLQRGIARFPEVSWLRLRLAGFYRDTGRTVEAARVLEGIGARVDTSVTAACMAGLAGAGFPDRAVALALDGQAVSTEIAFQVAAGWERLACIRHSIAAFEELLRQEPTNALACNYLGYMLGERGLHLDRAESLVRCALSIEPENPYYLDSLGWILYRQGRHAEALTLLRRALAETPEEPEVMKHLGIVLYETGSIEESRTLLRRASEAMPWDMTIPVMEEERQ